jgi:hypothetical protein
VPKKLSREERLAKRRKWMNSSRSLNGRLAPFRQAVDDAEKQILLECQDWGFGVKRAARCLHTTPLRIRRLLRKHGIRLPTQPTQEQVNAQCERLKAQAKNPAPTEDSLSRLARLMEEEQARKSVASAVNEAPAKPNGTQLARPVRRLESTEILPASPHRREIPRVRPLRYDGQCSVAGARDFRLRPVRP